MRNKLSRRAFAAGAIAFGANRLWAQVPGSDHGVIRTPLPVPDARLILADGKSATLHAILQGKGTAIQLMFTACQISCPMEGAIFEQVQKLLPSLASDNRQLLSLSINTDGERRGALSIWLQRFHAKAGWLAAVPSPKDLETLRQFFGKGQSLTDPHSTQVQIVNRKGNLVYRTFEMPSAQEVTALLLKL